VAARQPVLKEVDLQVRAGVAFPSYKAACGYRPRSMLQFFGSAGASCH
jgi:hypothetical protein